MTEAAHFQSRYSADTIKDAVGWLNDCARDAADHDPSVGIFGNEELAGLFKSLALTVECGEWPVAVSERGLTAGFTADTVANVSSWMLANIDAEKDDDNPESVRLLEKINALLGER